MYRKSINFTREYLILGFFILTAATAWAQRPLGTDVSGYQTNVNWITLKNAGVKFAWAKATEANYYYSPCFVATPGYSNQIAGATNAGIYIGAYHFARPSHDPNITGASSADTEAAYFWSIAGQYIKNGRGFLVPMLDWEDPGVSNQLTSAQMSQWVNEWCNTVSNDAAAAGVVGVRPVVYTGTWYSVPSGSYPGLTTAVTNRANWMSGYTGASAQYGYPATSPWPSWKIWQYADTNWSGGDADVYNGTLGYFVQNFFIGAPSISPTNVAIVLGTNATFSVTASGSSPFTYQWLFNGKVIPGANSASFTVTNAQLTNAGNYSAIITNSATVVSTIPAFLSVAAPLTNAAGSALAPPNMLNWWTADGNPNDINGTNNAIPYNSLYYTNGEECLAFHFDGLNNYLSPIGATEISPNWTVCMWVNRQNAPGVSAALMGDSTYALKLEQYGTNSNTHDVGFSKSGVGDYMFNPVYSAPANKWVHLAFVATTTSVSLYTNGVFEGSTNVSGFLMPRAFIGVDWFSGSPSDFLAANLDEIQTFHSALTATQISAIYAAGAAGLVRAPQFTGIATDSNDQVQLNLIGLTGKNFKLYYTTDLLNWNSLSTFSNPSGAVQYTDTVNSASAPQVFYRAAQ
jgi:GH25 family lysozyme M1 (1,4-beta-N-acetylmuramidase)